jgi:hypothetical protein
MQQASVPSPLMLQVKSSSMSRGVQRSSGKVDDPLEPRIGIHSDPAVRLESDI